MSGPTEPGSPPPEVPEEFAAAYREAYERALAAQTEGSQHREDPSRRTGRGSTTTDRRSRCPDDAARSSVGTHRTESYDDEPTGVEKRHATRPWFVPLLLTLLALLLILGAYAVGRDVRRQGERRRRPSSDPGVVLSESGSGQGATSRSRRRQPGEGAWDGKVSRIEDVTAKATLHLAAGLDAAGAQVTYEAAQPHRRGRRHDLAL